jgi:hypothetical protein
MSYGIKKCCICKEKFMGYGNNPWPFNGKTCCDNCNMAAVVPARIGLHYERNRVQAECKTLEEQKQEFAEQVKQNPDLQLITKGVK